MMRKGKENELFFHSSSISVLLLRTIISEQKRTIHNKEKNYISELFNITKTFPITEHKDIWVHNSLLIFLQGKQ